MSSIAMQMTKKMMKEQYAIQGTNREDGIFDPQVMRKASDDSMLMLKPEKGVCFTERKLGSLEAEACVPEKSDGSAVVLYIHGGGLIAGNAKTSRYYASIVANATGWTVYSCSYRLAPEYTCPAMQDDCISGYEALVGEYPNTPIVLIGESGGAYLAVITALTAKERGLRLPAAIAVNSVLIDLSGALTEERAKNAATDVSLSANALRQISALCCPEEALRTGWRISPLYGDYTDFPPLFLSWDAGEILAADSLKLMELVRAAGGVAEGRGCPDAFHGFQTMGHILPESEEVLRNTIAFIRAQL